MADPPEPGQGMGNDGVDNNIEPTQPHWDPSYLPQYFKGNVDTDFNQWCRKLEIAVQNYPLGAPPLASALPSRLDGKAFLDHPIRRVVL